jgi:hypothetical protein
LVRPIEEIPPGEWLFRGVPAAYLVGDVVLPDAFEVSASSVVRERYGTAASAISNERRDVAAAGAQAGRLPGPVAIGDTTFFFKAHDAPEEGIAHAEIRLERSGKGWVPNWKPGSKQTRATLKAVLARSFTIVHRT